MNSPGARLSGVTCVLSVFAFLYRQPKRAVDAASQLQIERRGNKRQAVLHQVARLDCFMIEAAASAMKDPRFVTAKPSTNERPDRTVQWRSHIDNLHGELRIAR